MKRDIAKYLNKQLFELIPFNIAIIDKDNNIVEANNNFKEYFGDWRRKKCFESYKKINIQCDNCKIKDVFETGKTIVTNQSGIDKNGRACHYVVHYAPLKDENDKVRYVLEMSTDLTETTRYQNEYNYLFENVPSYITIIDKNFKIIRSNKKFNETFGNGKGRFCYEAYKKRKKPCKNCPASKTFKDGNEHFSAEVGKTFSGQETQYIVQTSALSKDSDEVKLVMEIATDITEIQNLEEQLRQSHEYYANLIENATDAIIALDANNNVQIINKSAKKLLNWKSFKKPVSSQLKNMLPEEFYQDADENGIITYLTETYITTYDNKKIPVRFSAIKLTSKKEYLGRVAFLQDIRPYIELEKQKLEAERLSAIGQTVAGLAHTIKNLLMGLEGGMYITDIGLRKGDASRIVEGWEILQKNFYKTTNLVKGFLNFAKGKAPNLELIDPTSIVKEIIELYKDTAKAQSVELKMEIASNIKPAFLDIEGIEACLTNLLSNAIDAAVLREDKKGEVLIKVFDKDDLLIYEVIDNGIGMDSEIQKNVFTTFFTTKGSKGTGLGLLTTNKIVIEHGGKIELESIPAKGSTFRLMFNRKTLELIKNNIIDKN